MRNLLTAGAVVFLSGSAIAADLTEFEPPPMVAPVPAGFVWTGPYVGLQAGYAWGNAEINLDDPGLDDDDQSLDPEGWLIGAFVGYNYQFPSALVIGIEADLEWTDIDDSGSFAGYSFSAEQNWQGSLRGRLGYAFDRFLPYVTGGLAVADLEGSVNPPAPGASFGEDSTEWGWTVGVGADVAVTNNVFIRGEYRYASYSEFDDDDGAGEVQDFDTHTVRLGAGVKF